MLFKSNENQAKRNHSSINTESQFTKFHLLKCLQNPNDKIHIKMNPKVQCNPSTNIKYNSNSVQNYFKCHIV